MRYCPHCQVIVEPSQSNAGKLLGTLFGVAAARTTAAAGKQLVLALSAIVIGSLIDHTLSRTCPECGALLKLLIPK